MTKSEQLRTDYENAFGPWPMRIADIDDEVDAALKKALSEGIPWNRDNDAGEEVMP
jgi:hypothetical protein